MIRLCFWCDKRSWTGVCDYCWLEFKKFMMRGER